MNDRNDRKGTRAAIAYTVGFRRVGEELYESAQIDNLSPGGFYVTTTSNYVVGDMLDVKIRVGKGLILEKTRARVAHVRQGEGIGAEFMADDDELRSFLKMIVDMRVSEPN